MDFKNGLKRQGNNVMDESQFGTAAGTMCEGNDPRLSDARTPTPHTISSHSDTSATGAQLDTLVGGGQTTLHSHSKTIVVPHTFAITGEIQVPSGDTNFIPPFFIPSPAGQTVEISKVVSRINSGTSATVKLQRNGVDLPGFTSINVTTTTTPLVSTAQTLSDDDMISLVVTAVSGTPTNMSFTIYLEYTI